MTTVREQDGADFVFLLELTATRNAAAGRSLVHEIAKSAGPVAGVILVTLPGTSTSDLAKLSGSPARSTAFRAQAAPFRRGRQPGLGTRSARRAMDPRLGRPRPCLAWVCETHRCGWLRHHGGPRLRNSPPDLALRSPFTCSTTRQRERGHERIAALLRRTAKRDGLDEAQVADVRGRIVISVDIDELRDGELVIEAVPEIEDVKLGVFRQLASTVSPTAILASNTSSLSITRLASVTSATRARCGIALLQPRVGLAAGRVRDHR